MGNYCGVLGWLLHQVFDPTGGEIFELHGMDALKPHLSYGHGNQLPR